MQKREDIQIYELAYNKVKYGLWDNALYTPLQCCADRSNTDVCELKDNTGENISSKNFYYCETTGTYWIWKNAPETKYVGQCQYRRRLEFKEDFDFDTIFDKHKIINALKKAGNLNDSIISDIVNRVTHKLSKGEEATVDNIQRLVENELILAGECDIARDYISYRYIHDVARDKYKKLLNIIDTKLFAKDVKNQNANVDEHSFGGRKGEMASALMKDYALDYCMSKMAKNNHINNEIYIHDLDSYALGMHNCLSLPIDDLLKSGFTTRQVDIRPCNSVSTAFQLLAVMFQIQSLQQFGLPV